MSKKIKILILEDDQSLLDLYDLALPDAVFDKELAENGANAMEVYLSWRPDIILLDLLLPDISGSKNSLIRVFFEAEGLEKKTRISLLLAIPVCRGC